MFLTFDTKLRVGFPQPSRLDLQSLYIFNLYRSGSSVVEAAALALAEMTQRTANNVTQTLYDAGAEFFDSLNYSKPTLFLADEGAPLLKLCEIGGYLNYGFREIPSGFAAGFSQIGAAYLIARDPRDIGISHYSAVAKHDDDDKVYGDHVRGARRAVSDKSLEEYLLSDELIAFLNRICQCYRPLIERGMPVLQYEQLFFDRHFDVVLLCQALMDRFERFDDGTWELGKLVDHTRNLIANSKALQGHATSGTTAMYLSLPEPVLEAYSEKLRGSLDLLGY